MNNVEISVIIPCYNQGQYLREAIDSAKLQGVNYKTFTIEIIVVDDGSTDYTTTKLLDELEQTECRVIRQANAGLAQARNTGLQHAHGNYIQFLDADDVLCKDKLTTQLDCFDQDDSLAVCVSGFLYALENVAKTYTDRTVTAILTNEYPQSEFLLQWERGFSIPIHCALFRRSLCFKDCNIFDESVTAKEDWLFWCSLVLTRRTKFCFIDKPLVIYRIHQAGMCRNITENIFAYNIVQSKIALLIDDVQLRETFITSAALHFKAHYLPLLVVSKIKTWSDRYLLLSLLLRFLINKVIMTIFTNPVAVWYKCKRYL